MNTKKKNRNIAVCNDALRPDLTGFSVFQPALHDTGWRRLIGSPKLQIIFHKRATKYRSLLPKMTYKDKGSYESSPPCISKCTPSTVSEYGVATISRLLKIIRLFCRIPSLLQGSFAKETYNLKEPTNQREL